MARYEHSIEPATVWAFTTDLAHTSPRMLQIAKVEPNRRFVYDAVNGVVKPTVEYRIHPTTAGCRFTMSGWVDDPNLVARPLMPVAVPALRRETARHLENLRRVLGSRPS